MLGFSVPELLIHITQRTRGTKQSPCLFRLKLQLLHTHYPPTRFHQRAAESNDGLSVRLDKTDGFRFSRVSAVHGGTLSVNFQGAKVRIILHALDHGSPLISTRQAAVNRLIAALYQLIHDLRCELIQHLSDRFIAGNIQVFSDGFSEITVNICQVFEQEEFFY